MIGLSRRGRLRTNARLRRLLLLGMLLGAALLCAHVLRREPGFSPPVGTGRSVPFDSIVITGDSAFVERVSTALKLLKKKDHETYRLVERCVPRIVQGKHSAMWADGKPPTLELGARTANSSTTWLASAIAHDAMHSQLYADYRAAHGLPVPDEQYCGAEVERRCCAYQAQVLERIEAPQWEINWCRAQKGDHPDVTGDGKVDWEDYRKRDW
jgi:hypothetical protein